MINKYSGKQFIADFSNELEAREKQLKQIISKKSQKHDKVI